MYCIVGATHLQKSQEVSSLSCYANICVTVRGRRQWVGLKVPVCSVAKDRSSSLAWPSYLVSRPIAERHFRPSPRPRPAALPRVAAAVKATETDAIQLVTAATAWSKQAISSQNNSIFFFYLCCHLLLFVSEGQFRRKMVRKSNCL